MSQLHEELRQKFIDIDKEINIAMGKRHKLMDVIETHVENEPDMLKRKELIDNVFNGLDTMFGNHLKNVYLH